MIKVLHFGLTSHLGGIETYLYKIANHIDHTKIQMDFLIYGSEKPLFFEELNQMGCNFKFVTSRKENPLKNKKELEAIFSSGYYDIFHCHLVSLSNISHLKLAIKNDIPSIIHSHSSDSPSSFKSKILHVLNKKKLSFDKFNLISVSKKASRWMFDNNDSLVINNGLDIEKYKYDEFSRLKLREELKLSDYFTIIHVGRMVEVKNHSFLLDIFKQILDSGVKAKLLLVGPKGPLEDKIKQKISKLNLENTIQILGSREDIPQLFSASDVLVFPSYYEGFPGVVIEAQASGLPCVISDNITEEVVINFNCLKMSLNDDVKSWSDKIVNIKSLKDRDDGIKNIKKRGLTVEEEILKIEDYYENILK